MWEWGVVRAYLFACVRVEIRVRACVRACVRVCVCEGGGGEKGLCRCQLDCEN